METERKFRLISLPTGIATASSTYLMQGYVPVPHGELRLRSKGQSFYLTVKSDGALTRDEWEVEIPKWVFSLLWPATQSRLEKRRYFVNHHEQVLEIDSYRNGLKGLIIMECEFTDEQAAAAFELPEWAAIAVEVTFDPHYKNKVLASSGMPII